MFYSVYSVSLCCSAYCLCVNVYCTTATGCQPNCSLQIYHIISYHIISYHIISYHIISYHISYHIISYHIISYIISYHIISYHIISYHIISYHIRGVEVYLHPFVTSTLDEGERLTPCPSRLIPVAETLYPLNRELGVSQGPSGRFGEEESSCPYRDLDL
jgi:hypothetical protein